LTLFIKNATIRKALEAPKPYRETWAMIPLKFQFYLVRMMSILLILTIALGLIGYFTSGDAFILVHASIVSLIIFVIRADSKKILKKRAARDGAPPLP
jgi:hypothetical protein